MLLFKNSILNNFNILNNIKIHPGVNPIMELYATDLTLSFEFVIISLYGYFSIVLSPAMHYCACLPARGHRQRDIKKGW